MDYRPAIRQKNIILLMLFDFLGKANFSPTLKCHGGKSLEFIDKTHLSPWISYECRITLSTRQFP